MKLQVIIVLAIITLSSWGLVMAQDESHKTSNEGTPGAQPASDTKLRPFCLILAAMFCK